MTPIESPEGTRSARFEAGYRDLYAPVSAYVLRRLASPEEAAEVVAETFLTLWRRFDEAPGGEALRPWTYGVARRVIANHLRGERRRDALAERLSTDFAQVTAQLPDPAQAVAEAARVRDALAQLSDTDQELLRLVAWEGLTTDELAVALNIRAAAARLRLHRARRRLRAALNDEPRGKRGTTDGQVSERRETTSGSRATEGAS